LFIAFGLKIKLSSKIEYCNQRFPGKSTTECYEYIKAFNFSHMLMANINEAEAIGKYAVPMVFNILL
jgi:hypothetical protein